MVHGQKKVLTEIMTKYHECQICGKHFARNYSLKIHVESIHGDKKNYKFDRSDKIFECEIGKVKS